MTCATKGPPEIRRVDTDSRYFNRHMDAAPGKHRPANEPPKNPPRDPKRDPPDPDPPVKEPSDEDPAGLDATERFLLRLFLRRYVTCCARRRRFAQMRGAAHLSRIAIRE
jgi:hypothetical protein